VTGQRLLYCAPVMPALTGNGLAMRAGTILRALAERYRVSLLVVPRYWSPASELPTRIAESCEQVIVATGDVPAPGQTSPPSGGFGGLGRLLTLRGRSHPIPSPTFRDEPFDVVHVFRLATVEHVRPWLARHDGRPALHLDLDDVESITRRRIGERYEQTGQPELAQAERAAADHAMLAEAHLLHYFDRVYVCSDGDRRSLEARREAGASAQIEVLPNALPSPRAVPPPPSDGPFTFLFIGTLGYFPHEDAVVSFCREVLPPLRQMATRPFRVCIVGIGMTPAIAALAATPEVDVVGPVAAVSEAYGRVHAAIVPIKAGGGTRIKILEAFAHRRPVVTTTIGVEGIAARHDEHVLIADSPTDLARQCARLIASSRLADRLVTQAEVLFQAEYSLAALVERVRALPA
jgi:glycosyltransferase involved in cell wall biosynthesis